MLLLHDLPRAHNSPYWFSVIVIVVCWSGDTDVSSLEKEDGFRKFIPEEILKIVQVQCCVA